MCESDYREKGVGKAGRRYGMEWKIYSRLGIYLKKSMQQS
jgi:hypothetical protein